MAAANQISVDAAIEAEAFSHKKQHLNGHGANEANAAHYQIRLVCLNGTDSSSNHLPSFAPPLQALSTGPLPDGFAG